MELRKHCKLVLFFFLIPLLLIYAGGTGFLQARGAGAGTEDLSVILLIDISGSMSRTDPERLRETAANVFIDLLSADDYLGVVLFDDVAEVAIPLQQAEGSASKEQFKETLSPMLEPRGATDFKVALEESYDQFQAIDMGERRPLVVLLTDGEPNPYPGSQDDEEFMAQYLEEIWELAGQFEREGYPIYTVAFSDEIDPDFSERLSTETGGEYYILEGASDLLVTFFEVLGNLKNRMGFLEESFTGEERSFTFEVTELVSQVNLVAVNLAGGDVDLSLFPPGAAGEEGLAVSSGTNYRLTTLYGDISPGQWQATVAGDGEISVMGDMDYHIRSRFEEPRDGAQHPLHESLNFRVHVERVGEIMEGPLEVQVRVHKSGEESPVTVPLAEEGDYFVGSYEAVNRTGTYELELQLQLEDETYSTDSITVYVRRLPSLITDFWGGEALRLGEELQVTASMNVGGQRIREGRELMVEDFHFLFTYEDGEEVTVPLHDSGSPEHGDIRAGDGIWSNRINFEKSGEITPYLVGSGEYMGTEFLLEKPLEPFKVDNPGRVLLSTAKEEFIAVPGRTLSIPLILTSDSSFPETITLVQPQGLGRFSRSSFFLEPGQNKEVDLRLTLLEEVEHGSYPLELNFEADHQLTTLEPTNLQLSVEAVSAWTAFLITYSRSLAVGGMILAAIILALLIFYVGGFILYRLIVYPQFMIGGKLFVTRSNSGIQEENPTQTLPLEKVKKNPIVITFDPKRKEEADFFIEGGAFAYNIIIKSVWDVHIPSFLQGWNAIINREMPLRIFVYCTPPGILEHDGVVSTEKPLLHADTFKSGGFVFQYDNPHGEWIREKRDGIDVLEERT